MITKRDKILYIPIGLPACGKTTGRKRDAIVICKDDIRFMLLNEPQTGRDYYLDKTNGESNGELGRQNLEPEVDFIFKKAFEVLISQGWNIYLDGTNLISEHRLYYIRIATTLNYKIHFILYDNDEVAMMRNKTRKRCVPDEVINRMLRIRDKLTVHEKAIADIIEVIK